MKSDYYKCILPFFVLLLSLSFGCVSQRDVVYFQKDSLLKDTSRANILKAYRVKIQPADIVDVMVSSLNVEASTMFNPHQTMQVGTTSQATAMYNNPPAATGYLVNDEGNITLPLIGKVKVAGLSTTAATDTITKKLDAYLMQPTVNIRILNFKISVLGEVNRPSVYTIPNEKVTLPEAIALAGDLTIYGKRNNVMLIRENDGKRDYIDIDMTKRNLFNSPYYYLHPNDVLYVQPVKGRVTSSDRTIQLAPIIISGLTLITTLLIATFK